MRQSIRTLAWLRDLVIVLLVFAGFDLRHSTPRIAILLVLSAGIIFFERALWSWYLLNLHDEQHNSSAKAS
jgi:hypothetical protein